MPKIVVVTVTYGDRWPLLRRVVQAARSEGASLTVIVDNAATADITQLASTEFGSFAHVIRHTRNLGSAGGYKAGLVAALELGADFVLLLDDDNELQPGCLKILQEQHSASSADAGDAALAILGYRSVLFGDQETGSVPGPMTPRRDAFLGFSLLDLRSKLWRRTAAGKRALEQQPHQDCRLVEIAPYGGLFFSRAALLEVGLPNEDMVLYADDTEFSYRWTAAGGRIVLATRARIVDLERSWHVEAEARSAFDTWLVGAGDMRVYYAARNHVYWERHCRHAEGPLRAWNRIVFMCVLRVRAWRLRRAARYRLVRGAIADGEAGRLGEHPSFTL